VIKKCRALRRGTRWTSFRRVNGENAAAGFGITAKICGELHAGRRLHHHRATHLGPARDHPLHAQDKRLLRPAQLSARHAGLGRQPVPDRARPEVVVINVMCRLFMEPLDDPFRASMPSSPSTARASHRHFIWSTCMARRPARSSRSAIIATPRSRRVLGSHSHVPDLPTAGSCPAAPPTRPDVGMCGDYDSVIGMKKESAVQRFVRKVPGERLAPAEGEGTLCAALVETDETTGLAPRVRPIGWGAAASGPVNCSILCCITWTSYLLEVV
jgi:calcineurin-like phosphoesterase